MIGALTTQPGWFALTIDGVNYAPFQLPSALTPDDPLRISQSDLASGGVSITGMFGGTGMPNVLDHLTLMLPWGIDDTNAGLADAIEVLRSSGTAHDVAYWKQRPYSYTLADDQQVIFLPRRDAATKAYASFPEADNALTATLNGEDLTVLYKATVADDDSVPDGELWVSRAAIDHPDTGKANVIRCKNGSTIVDGDVLVVRYFPLYRMEVVEVKTIFSAAGREDKTVQLVEVD